MTKTFSYGANGVVGLARGKRLIILLARGGVYGEGPLNARHEPEQKPICGPVFSVIGIEDLDVIIAEGVDINPELRAAALGSAMGSIKALAA